MQSLFLLCLIVPALGESPKCVSDDRLKPITPDQIKLREQFASDEKPKLEKTFFINLKNSAFRRGRFNQLMKLTGPSGVPVERFEAIPQAMAKKADLTEFTQHGVHKYMQEVYGPAMWNTVGVYLSHAKLLKKIFMEHGDSDNMFLVLEDDVIPASPDWHKKLEALLPQVPKDWDMIRIGYGTDSNLRCQDKVTDSVFENRGPTRSKDNSMGFYIGNTAYLVRPKSIPKIFSQLASMPVLDVDGTMTSSDGGLRVYGVSDPLFYHGNGMGLSNRMNPFSLAQVIDNSVKTPETKTEESEDQKAFENFQEDLP